MPKRKRPLTLLFFAICSLILLGYLLFFVSPDAFVPFLFNLRFSIVLVFFFLLFLFVFSFTSFWLSIKHGIILSLFILIYAIFRFLGLSHPLFLLLLLAIFLILELLFKKPKDTA